MPTIIRDLKRTKHITNAIKIESLQLNTEDVQYIYIYIQRQRQRQRETHTRAPSYGYPGNCKTEDRERMAFSSQESRQANLTGDLWAPSSHITNCTLVECICPLQHCWNPTKSFCNAPPKFHGIPCPFWIIHECIVC
jgi:hypothetical protein